MRKLLLLSFLFFTNLILGQQVELIQKPGSYAYTMVIDKNNGDHIYSAGYDGMMFESQDGGESISPIETGFGTAGVHQILLDKNRPGRIFRLEVLMLSDTDTGRVMMTVKHGLL